ncbi:MAG: hypothetical protein HY701_02905 [Gemmatimonadetes bacterium]|nr:hypothetical protein [Gemmatimonadota bacterium]
MLGVDGTITMHSLADVIAGERVRIRRIHFDLVRDRCWEHGLAVGMVVRCLKHHATGLLLDLELENGRSVTADTAWARFVEVSPATSEESSRPIATNH